MNHPFRNLLFAQVGTKQASWPAPLGNLPSAAGTLLYTDSGWIGWSPIRSDAEKRTRVVQHPAA
jgi:hypothetical protein